MHDQGDCWFNGCWDCCCLDLSLSDYSQCNFLSHLCWMLDLSLSDYGFDFRWSGCWDLAIFFLSWDLFFGRNRWFLSHFLNCYCWGLEPFDCLGCDHMVKDENGCCCWMLDPFLLWCGYWIICCYCSPCYNCINLGSCYCGSVLLLVGQIAAVKDVRRPNWEAAIWDMLLCCCYCHLFYKRNKRRMDCCCGLGLDGNCCCY